MGAARGKIGFRERLRRLFVAEVVAAPGGRRDERRSLEPRPSVSGGRFSLVGLSELRAHLGDRWPELAERVHGLAQAVITRHLNRGDVFDAHGEDGYVVLFAQLSKAEADFKCRVIAKEIAGKLLGADWARLSVVDGVSIELEREAVANGDFELVLAEAIARGVRLEPQADEPGEPGPAAPGAPPAGGGDTFRAVPRARSLTAVRLRDLPAVERPEAPAAEPPARPGAYTPIWDFRGRALLHFQFNPPPDPEAATPGERAALAAKADLQALGKVLFDIGQLAQLGRRLPVVCPVRAGALQHQGWRGQLSRMLRDCPARLRRLVTLEVVIPAGAEAAWPRALASAWGNLPAACVARIDPASDLSELQDHGVIEQVNLALPDDFPSDKRAVARLDAIARQAAAAGLPCGVLGLRTRAMALAASAAGYAQLSGPIVHPDVASLGEAVRFDLQTFYRDLLPPR